MNASKFDWLARTLAMGASRRGLLATAGFLAIGRGQASFAAQLAPPTCAAAGEVCTLVRGCCDALTCVTSAINTNYGVCVPGEGGTVSIGTTLISPFSEEVEQEVAALANGATTTDTSTTATTTDLEAEREQRIAEKKARKDARRDDKRLRQDTHKDELQDRREDRRLAREDRRGPKLDFQLSLPKIEGDPEVVKVTNRDETSIVLNRIESRLDPVDFTELLPPLSLGIGRSFLFLSGSSANSTNERLVWNSALVCEGTEGAGFVVSAGFSASSENHEYAVFCDESDRVGGKNRRRRKRKRQAGRGGKGGKSRNKNG